MLLEGERLVLDGLGAGLEPELLLVRDDRLELMERLQGPSTRAIAAPLFERLGTLSTPPGVLGVFPRPAQLDEVDLEGSLQRHGLVLGVAGLILPLAVRAADGPPPRRCACRALRRAAVHAHGRALARATPRSVHRPPRLAGASPPRQPPRRRAIA